jgi:hypothetical protein
VTPERSDLSRFRPAPGVLAAVALNCACICVLVSAAQAQSNPQSSAQFNAQNNAPNAAPPAAAGLAPSGDVQAPKPNAAAPQPAPSAAPSVVALPPPQPQLGGQAGGQASGQASGQAGSASPTQSVGQAPAQAATETSSQPPAQPADQSASLPSAPDEKRGFFNDLGQWWNDSVANFNAKMKEQQAKLDAFNKQQSEAAKDATQAMKHAANAMFSPSKVIEVQQLCPVAGNGAPDCASAATDVCKAKGFSDGQPMDIRTAERCKASLWVSGQGPPTAANCPIETVLLRVACQQ